jgi:integrase
MGAVEPEFLQLLSWDPRVRVLVLPRSHPQFSGEECLVAGCDKGSYFAHQKGLCTGCMERWKKSGLLFEEFVTIRRPGRTVGFFPCQVAHCERPGTRASHLCSPHDYQRRKVYGLSLEDFLAHPEVQPLPALEPCQVAACDRQGETRGGYCTPHAEQCRHLRQAGALEDEDLWRLTTPAIAESRKVSLRGLPDRVVAEILFGLQERIAQGLLHKDYLLRNLSTNARLQQVTSLDELDLDVLSRHDRTQVRGFLKHIRRFGLSPETERHKDVWDASVFGLGGTFSFTGITQPWLREGAKAWALDDIPRRRGKSGKTTVQRTLKSLSRFSTSLHLSRDDHGVDLPVLGRVDITAFLGRLSFLNERGDISDCTQYMTVRDTRRVLTRLRTLGLTKPGQPLHGLADDFALRQEDIPDDPEDSEAGRDLPAEVMRQLCANLDALEAVSSTDVRTAVELIIDTGRRPNEICKLPWQCLDRESDGSPVLVYDNTKNLRHARRLPIPGATAALILKQQERARARFPDTPADKLKLFPATLANPHGTKATTYEWVSAKHRAWVKALPDFHVPTVIVEDGNRVTTMLPFDKNKIYPYAYRHTYAQRHADAGVPQDVLQSLMDHREASTTQRYYRVGEKRRREAVERVTTMQFDRHGTRIWRQAKTLLDSEHARRAIGSVQVPYGTCTEPSNVAAGGHDCPVRFRCVGCGHFRTDVSYLPDLEAYLADLLRNRERLAAFADADLWAKAEATPSDDEIARVRRLVHRVRQDLDELTDEDRAQIREAVAVVRRSRGVSLGMPRVRQPLPDLRPERAG